MRVNFYTGRNLRAYGKKFMGIRIEIYGHTYVISRACGWRCVSALSFIIILLLLRLSCRAGVGKIVV